ncbi:MAG: glycoside hydrolase family 3 C-terminal domain-containing protein, partial [Brevundimonas sp.]
NWADRNLPAILEAWYPGGQGGDAVARILAGDVNPSGRLPITFYRSADDLPAFTDYSMAGRTYRYFDGPVLYPFGHGLSYTRFAYSDVQTSPGAVGAEVAAEVSVVVANTADRAGDEIVQLYVSRPDVEGSPLHALSGAQRVSLTPGEQRRVVFTLDRRSLSTVDDRGVRQIAPGPVELWIGGGQPIGDAPGQAGNLTLTTAATLPE